MSRLRWMTAGESHGPRLVALVEGVPAGLPLLAADIDEDLARRQRGYGRGGRMKIETDRVELGGGLRDGSTLGSHIAMTIVNREHQNWLDRMSPGPLPAPAEPPPRPRPGHADLAGGIKYDRKDLRDVIERASAREPAARTAVGAVAKKLLGAVGIEVFAHVVASAQVQAAKLGLSSAELKARARASDLATGIPTGLGAHAPWDRKLDGRPDQALMRIQAVKGVEVGDGLKAAGSRGSQVHDAMYYDAGLRRFTRTTNRAGGLEGGISNGEVVACRAAMKPIATLNRALPSVDIRTMEAFDAAHERSEMRELVRSVDSSRARIESF
jgi:chorismate synthase